MLNQILTFVNIKYQNKIPKNKGFKKLTKKIIII